MVPVGRPTSLRGELADAFVEMGESGGRAGAKPVPQHMFSRNRSPQKQPSTEVTKTILAHDDHSELICISMWRALSD